MSSSLKQLKQRWLTDSPSRIGFILRLLLLGLITTVFLILYYYKHDLEQKNSFTQRLIDARVVVRDTYEWNLPLVPDLLTPYLRKHVSYYKKYIYELDASNTDITDDTLDEVALLDQIAWMNLENCRITDKTLERLQELKDLSRLNLKNTQITDSGLKYLTDLKHIEVINLEQTGVTREAVLKLQKQLKAARPKTAPGKRPVKDPVILF